mgnify:FL=1
MEDLVVSDKQEVQLEFPFESHHEYISRRFKEQANAQSDNVEMSSLVNHPPHYKEGEIECIDYLEDSLGKDGFAFYVEGNIKKYVHRWRHKGGVQDLKKAKWYLDRLISREEM